MTQLPNSSDGNTSRADLAHLDAVLEQTARNEKAPDFTFLAGDKTRHDFRSIAVVIIGLMIVTAVLVLDRDKGAMFAQQPTDRAIEVESPEQFAEFAKQITSAHVRIHAMRDRKLTLNSGGYPSPWLKTKLDLKVLIAELRASAALRRFETNKRRPQHWISLGLHDGRRLQVTLLSPKGGEPALLLAEGMITPMTTTPALAAILDAAVRRAEAITQRHMNIYDQRLFSELLQSSDRPDRLILVDCTAGDLQKLQRSALASLVTHLDLRRSPQALSDTLISGEGPTSLAAIADMPRLRSLTLSGAQFTTRALAAFRPLRALEELIVLEPFEHLSTTNVFKARARAIDDRSLELLRGFHKLRHLELPGAKFTDAGLLAAKLGDAWPDLEVLNFSRVGPFTGSGLATFANHRNLRHITLRDIRTFNLAGARALSRIGSLESVGLLGSGEASEPRSLLEISKLKRLQRLDLGTWFAGKRIIDRHRNVAAFEDDPNGNPVFADETGELPKTWREALQEVATTPSLRYLGLTQSHLFTITDVEALSAAHNLEEVNLTDSQRIVKQTLVGLEEHLPFRILHD